MMRKASYVLQADRLLPTLTVRETLTYMAYLKLPGYTTESEIEAKVKYEFKKKWFAILACIKPCLQKYTLLKLNL